MDVQIATTPLHDVDVDLLVFGASEKFADELSGIDQKLGGRLVQVLKQRNFTGKGATAIVVPTFGRLPARDLMIVAVGDRSADALARAAGRGGRQARDLGARSMALSLGGEVDVGTLIEAAAAGNYAYDKFKAESERQPPLEKLVLSSKVDKRELAASDARSRWQSWARDLVNGPAAEVNPATLADAAKSLSRLADVTVEVWEVDRLKAEGCIGLVAVGQGSTIPPVMVHVRYRPKGAKNHVALVGKGVTFDSGGLSLKPSAGMQTMRCDMAGAATVLAALGAAAENKLPIAVDAIVGCVENMNSGGSYKLGDILSYRNGVTVEIHNTDAEGRLVLADCLINACREKGVTDVLDVATLTGAIVVALGSDFTGMYTPDTALAAEIDAAAAKNGEGVWRMPLHDPYKQMLKGDWGQLKNVTGKPDAGAGTAALFLQHFVEGVRWAHLDIAGSAFFEKQSGFYAAGGTGQFVRTLVSWLEAKANP